MEPLVYREDPEKLKSSVIRSALTGLAAAVIGLLILLALRPLGYLEAALGGCLLGGGTAGFAASLRGFARIAKPPLTLLSLDSEGVTLRTGPHASHTIPWGDIKAVAPAKRGVQSGVSLYLRDPDAYLNSMDPQEQKLAKQNARLFGSPASVATALCATSKEEIAYEINGHLQRINP